MSEMLTVATSGVGAFSSFLPPIHEVRKSVNDPKMKNDVRTGEVIACVVLLAVGGVASMATKSRVPVITAAIFAAGFVCLYESVLAATPKEVKP